jgi:uncharacterized protein (DUF1015 family)
MAVVKPFRSLRYDFAKAGGPETICCPPYDVIPDASAWTARSPHNAVFLEGGERLNTADPYGGAKKTLDSWLRSGVLTQNAAPAFYIYEAAFTASCGNRKVLRGLTGLLELSPYSDGVVLPHEYTLEKDGEDRRRLMAGTGCQFSPIYCLYDDPEGKITLPDQPPEISFTMPDGVTHSLSSLSDPGLCAAISEAFADKKIYIADGHHRYGTLLKLREQTGQPQYAMAFFTEMSSPGVDLRPTHRVVTLPHDPADLRKALEEKFTISGDGPFGLVTQDGEVRLTPKRPSNEKSSVAALHNDILEPLLGIDAEAMAKGGALVYTRDIGEARGLVHSGKARSAFLLPPPEMRELRETVLAGEKMPQKSTYFYPKIITGLFMYLFES